MKLEIIDPNNQLDHPFIKWLIKQIQKYCISHMRADKLKRWDTYFSTKQFRSIYKKHIKARDILTAGIYNLTYIHAGEAIQIQINPNTNMVGFDRIKISSLCRLINYGNQEISGYPILTDVFQHFSEEFTTYLEAYIRDEGGL